MAVYECDVCGYQYDEAAEGTAWDDLPADWSCEVCFSGKSDFKRLGEAPPEPQEASGGLDEGADSYERFRRPSDEREVAMADIHQIAETGRSIIDPMRTGKPIINWDDILIKGAQLARLPLNKGVPVNTRTVIGPGADRPLLIESPVYVTHMSFGALSREAKVALARGSAGAKTAMCSGEGGILPESMESAYRYIFEYVPNLYSVTDENLRAADAIEIKIGQSVKPGMGGHLPAEKVTAEIAAVRGKPQGADIISPAHFADILDKEDLKRKVAYLREVSGGRPIGVKVAAGDIEADLAVALYAAPDFITVDGRGGATGAAPRFVKDSTSVPTVFALYRTRRFLDQQGASQVSLLITGGLRISSDFAKALALGADGIAIGTAAMIACGCQQYRVCHTGRCPMGIATQDPELRVRLDVDAAAKRVENFLRVSTEELKTFARLAGVDDVHQLSLDHICTTNSEISNHTAVAHV